MDGLGTLGWSGLDRVTSLDFEGCGARRWRRAGQPPVIVHKRCARRHLLDARGRRGLESPKGTLTGPSPIGSMPAWAGPRFRPSTCCVRCFCSLYSVRSERLLMEQLAYNLLFREFVGLTPTRLADCRRHQESQSRKYGSWKGAGSSMESSRVSRCGFPGTAKSSGSAVRSTDQRRIPGWLTDLAIVQRPCESASGPTRDARSRTVDPALRWFDRGL